MEFLEVSNAESWLGSVAVQVNAQLWEFVECPSQEFSRLLSDRAVAYLNVDAAVDGMTLSLRWLHYIPAVNLPNKLR